jgi:hypothetical protein
MAVSLINLLDLARRLGVSPAALFVLPDVHNEAALRAWLLSLCRLAEGVAALTKTAADDQTVAFLETLVNTPESWKALYAAILAYVPADGKVRTGAQEAAVAEHLAKAAAAGNTTIEKIMEIIRAIIAWLQQFQK